MSDLTACIDRHLRTLGSGRSTLLVGEYAAMLDDVEAAAGAAADEEMADALRVARRAAAGELVPVSTAIDALLDLRLAASLLPA